MSHGAGSRRPTVYLAGPITGKSYDQATDWRDIAVERLAKKRIKGVSPLRGKYYLEGLTDIPKSLSQPLSTPRGITTRDRWDCQRADVVLFNFTDATIASIGSCIELGWADGARNPIVLALPDGAIHDHPMVREVAGFVLPSLEEALTIVEAILS